MMSNYMYIENTMEHRIYGTRLKITMDHCNKSRTCDIHFHFNNLILYHKYDIIDYRK